MISQQLERQARISLYGSRQLQRRQLHARSAAARSARDVDSNFTRPHPARRHELHTSAARWSRSIDLDDRLSPDTSKPRHRPGLFCWRLAAQSRAGSFRPLKAANSGRRKRFALAANRCNMRAVIMFAIGDTMAAPIKFGVGQSVLRKEDDALIRGKGRYTDDHRAAACDACAGAALAACAREIHHQCHQGPRPAGRRRDPDRRRRQGSRRPAVPVQSGSRSVHRPALSDPRPRTRCAMSATPSPSSSPTPSTRPATRSRRSRSTGRRCRRWSASSMR